MRSASVAASSVISLVRLTDLLWSIISDEPTPSLEQETVDDAEVKYHAA